MARCSDSTEEREIVFCFLDFQQSKEPLRNTQKLVTDLRTSRQAAQSEPKKLFK